MIAHSTGNAVGACCSRSNAAESNNGVGVDFADALLWLQSLALVAADVV
jgi:hypothetical protein